MLEKLGPADGSAIDGLMTNQRRAARRLMALSTEPMYPSHPGRVAGAFPATAPLAQARR